MRRHHDIGARAVRRPRLLDDAGSASVLAVGVIAALLAITLGALAVLSAVRSSHVARSTADLAALAAAGRIEQSGDPAGACEEARRVAGLHDAAVVACTVDGSEVSVTTSVGIPLRLGGVGPDRAEGRARAGPAPAG